MKINFAQSKVTVRALFEGNKFSKRMLGPINPNLRVFWSQKSQINHREK